MGANDFIPVVAAATNLPSTVAQIGADGVARLAVSYIATNANFQVKNFGVVAMLSIPIPANAAAEDRYSIRLTAVSATSDGLNGFVRLNTQPAREIIVKTNLSYLVGDSAPTGWYNAEYAGSVGSFGDNVLDNRDVNNAFYASLGVRVPYEGSDAFDAMDVFPEDIGGIAGGDLKIRFLDWQVILQRSLGLKTNSFRRMWAPGGFRVASVNPTPALGDAPGTSFDSSTNGGWSRAALLGALPVVNAQPGMVASVPVYLKTKPGISIAGMAFRATIETPAGAAPVTSGLQFVPAVGIPNPVQSAGLSANVLLVGWPMLGGSGAFTPSLQGSNLIGYVNFTIPGSAVDRVVYRLNFAFASGSPDFTTEYDFEVISSGIGVRTSAFQLNDGTPDDWKIHYFGSVDNPAAQATADPDGDGVTNYQEYLLNSNPVDFRLSSSVVSPGGVKLSWYGARGISYVLESSGTRGAGSWTAATNATGQGAVIEFVDGNSQSGSRFYRLRLAE